MLCDNKRKLRETLARYIGVDKLIGREPTLRAGIPANFGFVHRRGLHSAACVRGFPEVI